MQPIMGVITMPVFRVEKKSDYTVMSNHHLRNQEISLRAKGLLSQMLSLPTGWDYTLVGLAVINLEGIDAIREAVKELERAGYVTRERQRNTSGQFTGSVYVIRELPIRSSPALENPTLAEPVQDKPVSGPPTLENPTELKKKESNTEKSNTDGINPSFNQLKEDAAERKRNERIVYRQLILENIEYEYLLQCPTDREEVDEIVEIIGLFVNSSCL